jgi:FKBP-type peptidyl-prolyl cis-trans isomerase FkpA
MANQKPNAGIQKPGSGKALWLLASAAALAAVGAGTWAAMAHQAETVASPAVPVGTIKVETLKAGTGPKPTEADVVLVKYRGTLDDGTEFDASEAAPMPVAGVVPGFAMALLQMQRGGSYRFVIPPALGYGADAVGPIPANSNLHFEVDLIDFRSMEEIRAMQQQMQGGQGAPGGPGGPPPGADRVPQ